MHHARCALQVRLPWPEQMREGDQRRQAENAEAYVAKRGIVIDETQDDLGISAYRAKNWTSGALAADLDRVEGSEAESGLYVVDENPRISLSLAL